MTQKIICLSDRVLLNHDAIEQHGVLHARRFANVSGPRADAPTADRLSLPLSHFNTLSIRTGHVRSFEQEHSEPIFETSSYIYATSAESEAAFSGASGANVYSRFTNPTVQVFEKRLAALERAEAGVATASGMAALLSIFTTFLSAGDHVLCSRSIFGSTAILLKSYFEKFNVAVTFVPIDSILAWREAVRPQTKLVFCETPTNPLLAVADVRALAEVAKRAGAMLVVDNTFCTPCGQNPLGMGADIVLHSVGKYIDGQGRCIGGIAVGGASLMEKLRGFMRCAGPAMSAHSAWVFLKGLETLQLRMLRHSENAQVLAEWLSGHPRVTRVYYPGLQSHPQHSLASYQQRLHGGVLSFEVYGTRNDAWRCIDAMRMISRTANVGDAKTMVTHPASTTHLKLSLAERAAAGVKENLIRISVGLEDIQDIVADVAHGLEMM